MSARSLRWMSSTTRIRITSPSGAIAACLPLRWETSVLYYLASRGLRSRIQRFGCNDPDCQRHPLRGGLVEDSYLPLDQLNRAIEPIIEIALEAGIAAHDASSAAESAAERKTRLARLGQSAAFGPEMEFAIDLGSPGWRNPDGFTTSGSRTYGPKARATW